MPIRLNHRLQFSNCHWRWFCLTFGFLRCSLSNQCWQDGRNIHSGRIQTDWSRNYHKCYLQCHFFFTWRKITLENCCRFFSWKLCCHRRRTGSSCISNHWECFCHHAKHYAWAICIRNFQWRLYSPPSKNGWWIGKSLPKLSFEYKFCISIKCHFWLLLNLWSWQF